MRDPVSDPVVAEAVETARELRLAQRAARSEEQGSLAHRSVEELRRQLDTILEVPEHREQIAHALDLRARSLRTAVTAWRHTIKQRELIADAVEVASNAARVGRQMLAIERTRARELHAEATHIGESSQAWLSRRINSTVERDLVLAALSSLSIREARAQLRDGLLLTLQMRDIIAEATPALRRGEPVLLLGETGGAKTALAEYLSYEHLRNEPEFISGYGDISSTQLVGSHELRPENGATASRFVPGPLLRAMSEGRPLILDEINAMPPEFLKRLNRVLQLRPGDQFSVQENGGERVTIHRGFAILATANEQTPHRYRGIDRMSAELLNRFGANSYRIHYPDSGRSFTEVPTENALLAAAAIADERGEIPITPDELERVCRAAFISQQVFSGEHGEGFGEFVSIEREIDGRPGLEESVLAPRTLVGILQKVAGSAGQVSLDQALQRFVEGVMHAEDREVLTLILRSQGFDLAQPR